MPHTHAPPETVNPNRGSGTGSPQEQPTGSPQQFTTLRPGKTLSRRPATSKKVPESGEIRSRREFPKAPDQALLNFAHAPTWAGWREKRREIG